MRNARWKWLKVLAAVALGLALLELFCTWYYNPVGYLQDESRSTDVIREPGAFTSRATEGFAWSVVDANGYNNREVPAEDGVFVLMMGSSHTEGFNVMPGEDISSQLGGLLAARGFDGAVYNIGISSHQLPRNIFNLDRALTRFEPSGYVVLETRSVEIVYESLRALLDGDMERLSAMEVVLTPWLSERALLRTVGRQLLTLNGVEEEAEEGDSDIELTQEMFDLYRDMLTQAIGLVRQSADAHGVVPIIYYHPTLLLQPDGSAVPDTDDRALEVFASACEAAGVRFIDMTSPFLEAYEREHVLPHGFANTAPSVGHLNARGCGLVAQVLCEAILEQEGVQ